MKYNKYIPIRTLDLQRASYKNENIKALSKRFHGIEEKVLNGLSSDLDIESITIKKGKCKGYDRLKEFI